MAAPRALVGDVVLALGDEQHEHLAPAPAPAPERAVRAVREHALELGRGLLALCLGCLLLDVPVDDEASHVHLLFDAEVQSELGLHVVSSRLVRRGNPLRSPWGRAMQLGATRVGWAVAPTPPGAGCGRVPRRCARLARRETEGDLKDKSPSGGAHKHEGRARAEGDSGINRVVSKRPPRRVSQRGGRSDRLAVCHVCEPTPACSSILAKRS